MKASKKVAPQRRRRVLAEALKYLHQQFEICRVAARGKAGIGSWQSDKITLENVARYFSKDENIGLLLGARSRGLTDVDLDCPEAALTVSRFLPPTPMISGRVSKPRSHLFFCSNLHETEDAAALQYKDVTGGMICELRTAGGGHAALTVAPPSEHESGELVEWNSYGEPPWVDGEALKQGVARGAAAALLARHYPDVGSRHDAALAIDGFLTRLEWPIEVRKTFIECVATAANDEEVRDRVRVCDRTERKLENGQPVRGFPGLSKVFGADVAKAVASWLGYKGFENEALLAEMNEKFAVVSDGGRVSILQFDLQIQKNSAGHIAHKRYVPTFFSFNDFHNYHKNRLVHVDNGKGGIKTIALGNWWTQNPGRRTVAGLTFRPDLPAGELVDGRLNLWRGWGVEPAAGDWSLMKQHIRDVLASGEKEAFDYIMNWLAWSVQHPAERAQVALVFKGGRGVGKGTLGNAMCHIFGQHATHISSVEHLARRFNAHLRDAVLLFADEAYWGGDKIGEGTLKRLITEPTLFIEAKGRDGVTVPNMLHVIMASNENWLVPAGEHERRYAVFKVSEVHRQNDAWFAPLYRQMDEGGHAAMLHDLLTFNLDEWHPRHIPMTEALREQQLQSLEPLDAWLLGLFEDAVLPEGPGVTSPNVALSRSSPDYDQRNPRNGLYDIARERYPKLKHLDDQVLAAHLKRWGCKPWRNSQARGWEFPPLAECRARWELKYPSWPWRHLDITEWQAADTIRWPIQM